MIRVLQIGLTSNYGGIENVVHGWLPYIREDIVFDCINYGTEPLAYEEDYRKAGGRIYRIEPRHNHPFRHYMQLKRIISSGEHAVIHCHVMTLSEPEPIMLANRYGARIIIHGHSTNGSLTLKRKMIQAVAWCIAGKRDYTGYACSHDAGSIIFRGRSFKIIENGIDLDQFRYSNDEREVVRKELGLEPDDDVIGHVGRASPEKNYPFLLQTFREVKKKNTHAKLLLVGNVDKNAVVQNMIDSYGIRDGVICTGEVYDTKCYYQAMDLFFLPSIYEGVSVSLIEAQAMGLPCVASSSISKESVISHQFRFVDPDINQAVSAIIEQMRDPVRRDHVTIDERYHVKNSAKKVMDGYLVQ
ncbi:MAG: glycosyltransferase [Lachnospiraceae bacterium]|nr:glycosyltransferase [Lachnospiraceae bacterium]